MILDGTIIDGLKVASRSVAVQLPIFERHYDELRGAYPGTINVDVGHPLDLRIDFETDPIETGNNEFWCFEFVRVMFEYPLETKTKARIYQPYGFHWGVRGKKSIVEVLVSKRLDAITPGKHCRIHVLNERWGSSSTSPHFLKETRGRL